MAFAIGDITTKAGVGVSCANIGTSSKGTSTGVKAISCSMGITTPLTASGGLTSLAMDGTAVSPTFDTKVAGCATSIPFRISGLGMSTATTSNGTGISIGDPGLAPGNAAGIAMAMATRGKTGGACAVSIGQTRSPGCIPDNGGGLSNVSISKFLLSPIFGTSAAGCMI